MRIFARASDSVFEKPEINFETAQKIEPRGSDFGFFEIDFDVDFEINSDTISKSISPFFEISA